MRETFVRSFNNVYEVQMCVSNANCVRLGRSECSFSSKVHHLQASEVPLRKVYEIVKDIENLKTNVIKLKGKFTQCQKNDVPIYKHWFKCRSSVRFHKQCKQEEEWELLEKDIHWPQERGSLTVVIIVEKVAVLAIQNCISLEN